MSVDHHNVATLDDIDFGRIEQMMYPSKGSCPYGDDCFHCPLFEILGMDCQFNANDKSKSPNKVKKIKAMLAGAKV